jgi:peptide/nickel transport system substrate-binding protein
MGLIIVVATGAGARPVAGTTAVVRQTGDYVVLDWMTRATQAPVAYSYPLYDRLVAYDRTGTKILPDLAKSWVAVPPGRPRAMTFTLKHGIKCGDGHELTPIDVVNSFKRFFDAPKISNQLPNFFGRGPYHLHADMKKWTFTFRTETPFANMIFGFAQSGIICPAGLEALKSDPQALNKQAYGTGPYTLVSATHGDSVVYQKNPKWVWGPPGTNIKTMPDQLIYKIIPDQTTAANLILTGGLDFGTILGPDVARLAAEKSLQHKTVQNYYPMPLVFSQSVGKVTTDDKVREAIMTAVDGKAFAQAAFLGNATVTPSYLNPSEPCYDKSIAKYLPTGGPAKAQQVLRSAGYASNSSGVMTKGGSTLRLTLLTSPDLMGSGGEYLAHQLQAAGFEVNLQDLPATQYSANYVGGNFDAAISFSFQYAPAQGFNIAFYSGATPPKGNNAGNIGGQDQEYSRAALFATQHTTCDWWYRLQRLILQKHVMLPLAEPINDSFGTKKWDFPVVVQALEPAWIRPYRS